MMIRGYITNLGKYNEGYLVGKWIDFPIDEDELREVLKEIQIDGIRYEEYFFTDWECDAGIEFSEFVSIDRVNEIAEQAEEWGGDLFAAACELFGADEALRMGADSFYLLDGVDTDLELGEYYAGEFGILSEIPEHLRGYFDFIAYGRDIRLSSEGGFVDGGYLEVCR